MPIDPIADKQHPSTGGLHAVPSRVLLEILEWSKSIEIWQQEAVRRILRKGELSEQDASELISAAEIALKIKDGSLSFGPLTQQDIPTISKTTTAPLLSVKNLHRVNAIRPDQKLSFGKHLTVIYGDNGSGKSGYARIMKRACRSRVVSEILPNVYNPPSALEPAAATLEFEVGGQPTEELWIDDGNNSLPWLGRFAVFDSDCGRVYINGKTELAITPMGLDVLPKLGALVDKVKRHLEDGTGKDLPNIEALKAATGSDTTIGQMLANLTADTRIEFIEKQAAFDEKTERNLIELQEQLKQAQIISPERLHRTLSENKRYADDLVTLCSKLETSLSDQISTSIKDGLEKVQSLDNAIAATAKQFDNEDLSGIGEMAWRELLLAAEKYSMANAYPSQPFPAPDSVCVLCQQSLTPEATDRLVRFRNFLHDESTHKRQEAASDVDLRVDRIKALNVSLPDYRHSLENIFGSASMKFIDAYFQQLKTRQAQILDAVKAGDWYGLSPAPVRPEVIDRQALELAGQLSTIASASSQSEAITLLEAQIANLKARKLLSKNLGLVQNYLAALHIRTKYKTALEGFSTRTIATKAKDMQARYVTEEFKQALTRELKKAKLTKLAPLIVEKADKGRVLRELAIQTTLKNAKPEHVFSEGERTAIALACFVAELGSESDTSGIIFDDPVTSLDHHIRSSIAQRLVGEAQTRQVIVFTHDLVFFRELLEYASLEQVAAVVQCVNSFGDNVGVITSAPPWEASKVTDRIKVIDGYLKRAEQAEKDVDVTSYREALELFYKRLRETWERSIEELMFCDVVQRFERGVSTLKLTGAVVDDAGIEMVFQGMTKSSTRVHDLATSLGATQIKLSDAQTDLDAFKAFISNQNTKRKAAEASRSHLKDKVKISQT